MEVECLALKDLTSPRKSFSVQPEEDEGQSEQKVSFVYLCFYCVQKSETIKQSGVWKTIYVYFFAKYKYHILQKHKALFHFSFIL